MDPIYTRAHATFSARQGQLSLNMLAWKGGRPYVNERLWRAPNESDLSWKGATAHATRPADDGTVGRKDRAVLVNDAGRVVSKISQYLFKQQAGRPGADETWAANVDGYGTSISDFWLDVSEMLTTGQWVWLQADRGGPLIDPDTGLPRERSLLEKQRDNDFIRWSAWPSVSVPDWCVGADGSLLWIITQDTRYDNSDPFADAKTSQVRTLWRKVPAGVEISQWKISGETSGPLGSAVTVNMPRLPFVLLGTPSSDPWWFDDVELLQAQLMNLDSLHVENLVRTVFPQLVIPSSALESLEMRIVERYGQQNGEKNVEIIRELLRGLDTPLTESKDDSGITRFLTPNAGDLKSLPDEVNRKRGLLFDTVGLSLFNRETRQIQTAESKQFDQLDTESTLKHRAQVMQEAEARLVALSKQIDPMFREYAPVWPTSFDVVDAEKDSATIATISNMPDVTPSMRKLCMLAALRLLEEAGGYERELIETARAEIAVLADGLGEGAEQPADTTGKIPLAIQQLALARERAMKSGDAALAAKLAMKIDELTARV